MCDIVKLDKYQTCRRKIEFFDLLHYARIDDDKIREKRRKGKRGNRSASHHNHHHHHYRHLLLIV